MSKQSEADNSVKDNLEIVYLALKIVTALCLIAALYEYSTSRPQYILFDSTEVGAPLKLNQSTGNVQVLSRGGSSPGDVEWINLGKEKTE